MIRADPLACTTDSNACMCYSDLGLQIDMISPRAEPAARAPPPRLYRAGASHASATTAGRAGHQFSLCIYLGPRTPGRC